MFLPEGQASLAQVSRFISQAPAKLGIPRTAVVRSVLVQRADSRWVNHCTAMRLGTSSKKPGHDIIDVRAGPARLISREFCAGDITTPGWLIEALTTWRVALPKEVLQGLNNTTHGPLVVDRFWDFQDPTNVYHHRSENIWGKPPCWTVDVLERLAVNGAFQAPRAMYRNDDHDLFATDLGTLTKNWCNDPTWRDDNSVRGAYRIVVPDQRAFIAEVAQRDHEIRVLVNRRRNAKLICALTSWDIKNNDEVQRKAVTGREVGFALSDRAVSFEVHLLDDSDTWCDHTSRTLLASAGVAPPSEAELPVGQSGPESVVDLLAAPRYEGPRGHVDRALEYLDGPAPDLANASKEAVCAVESLARIVTGRSTDTLGDIIKLLKRRGDLDPAIGKTLEGLWGYTSNAPGVRHGGTVAPTITEREARWVVDMSQAALQFLLELDRPT